MNLENYFISQFKNSHIGDDGALIDDTVYSKDAFFENIHFKSVWMSYYQIASKAMIVNISDAIAMNAKPKYALLSVAMPKDITKAQMRDLARGFQDTAAKYGVQIIGGDTISNVKLDISVTIISKIDTKTDKPLRRKGLKHGHLLAYTGRLGDSAKDLKKLMNLGKIHVKSKFVNIVLRDNFVSKSSRYLSCGMDISDGLFSDLEKLSLANRVGFKFKTKIKKSLACSGEEYEMLVGFDKRYKKAILRRAKQSRTKLNIFAQSTRSGYVNRCKAHHFKNRGI
ncbi:MAG: thiamine-phosphate kinase [Sulfurimonas sp. RIFOXYD12_FULL_33_39]|uniref:thiamine-phosphate kinase n=1 Tax=unclassified Sulfurimonas TaxID=2623549 RepID=UPI0008D1B490|nr:MULTISPECIES: thiamine-phosphate kinase [unclassified Sulfurimonas]OHE09462.1 MAG: thiamine-phosphate kinase [Sulfurimonas sp. RIFOXYD12_FULL_33_39]OHE12757.1 MAG: thiamine-phosphate kinase [Sulfurimonas sp. RIFOXYD2_FULL_34_21]